MRLYNIYYLCKSSVDGIKNLKAQGKTDNSSNTYLVLTGWGIAVKSLETLRQISFLKEETDNLLKTIPSYERETDNPEISQNTYGAFENRRKLIVAKLEAIIDLYESMERGESAEGIDVKIPNCDTLDEYIQYLKDINFVLTKCPMISGSDEQITFNTVDVGSMWLSFIIKGGAGGHVILSVLSKISDVALKIKTNFNLLKAQNEMLETMRQKNEIGEEVIDAYRKLKTMMLDQAVTELENDCGERISEPEDRARAATAIEKLSELFDKGVEIYSAIETPQDIKVIFPFTENAPVLPEGLQKLIEAKEDDN